MDIYGQNWKLQRVSNKESVLVHGVFLGQHTTDWIRFFFNVLFEVCETSESTCSRLSCLLRAASSKGGNTMFRGQRAEGR